MRILKFVVVCMALASVAATGLLWRQFPNELHLWLTVIGSQLIPIVLIRKPEHQLPAIMLLYSGFGTLIMGIYQLVRH